ncbi:MAG: GNAT family N-acetyltransferase, partial [Cellulomonas sp.]
TAQRLYDRLGFRREPDRDWGHEGVALRVYSWHVPPAPGVRVEVSTWRPVEVRDVDGWRVGLSGGFTRRANSAVPAHGPDVREIPLEITLDAVEECYREAGYSSVVRVRRSSGDGALDDVLAARGYTVASRTWVMVLDLPTTVVAVRPDAETSDSAATDDADVDAGDVPVARGRTDAVSPDLRVTLAAEPDAEWLACWLAVKTGAVEPDAAVARAVVTASPALYLAARDQDGVVGVLRAAWADDWVGLSCLAVSTRARGHGLARTLTAVALETATGRGARHAFLQVEDENSGARRLYESLGFVPAERYHYRER